MLFPVEGDPQLHLVRPGRVRRQESERRVGLEPAARPLIRPLVRAGAEAGRLVVAAHLARHVRRRLGAAPCVVVGEVAGPAVVRLEDDAAVRHALEAHLPQFRLVPVIARRLERPEPAAAVLRLQLVARLVQDIHAVRRAELARHLQRERVQLGVVVALHVVVRPVATVRSGRLGEAEPVVDADLPVHTGVEPDLVADDPAAQVEAVLLVPPERGTVGDALRGQFGVDVVRLETGPLEAEVGRSEELVRARLDDGGHRDAGRHHLGVVAGGAHLELLVGEVADVHARVRVGTGRDVDPLDHQLRLSTDAVVDDALPGDEVAVPHLRRARRDDPRGHDVGVHQTASPRHRVEHLVGERDAGGGLLDIHHRTLPGHRHRLLEGADGHRDIDLGREADGETLRFTHHGLEAGQLEPELVHSRREIREAIVSVATAHHDVLSADEGTTRERYRDARQHAAGVVGDVPLEGRGALLRRGRRSEGDDRYQ